MFNKVKLITIEILFDNILESSVGVYDFVVLVLFLDLLID